MKLKHILLTSYLTYTALAGFHHHLQKDIFKQKKKALKKLEKKKLKHVSPIEQPNFKIAEKQEHHDRAYATRVVKKVPKFHTSHSKVLPFPHIQLKQTQHNDFLQGLGGFLEGLDTDHDENNIEFDNTSTPVQSNVDALEDLKRIDYPDGVERGDYQKIMEEAYNHPSTYTYKQIREAVYMLKSMLEDTVPCNLRPSITDEQRLNCELERAAFKKVLTDLATVQPLRPKHLNLGSFLTVDDDISNPENNMKMNFPIPHVAYQMVLEKFNSEMLATNRTSGGRSTSYCPPGGCVVLFDLSKIMGYGCWCNFQEDLAVGSGQPVDKYDELCRSFQLCMRCARWDGKQSAKKGGDSCNIHGTYNVVSGPAANSKALMFECSEANSHEDCGTHLCCCYSDLIAELIGILWNPVSYNHAYKHSNGFNVAEKCDPPIFQYKYQMACCGYYPNRFPYGTVKMECCDNHSIYNPAMNTCCGHGDGTYKPAGTC